MRNRKNSVNPVLILFLLIFLVVPLIVVLKPHRIADGEWHQVSRFYLVCLIAYGFGIVGAAASGGLSKGDIFFFGPIPVPVVLIPFICLIIALIGGFRQTPEEYLIGDGIRCSAENKIVSLQEYNFPEEEILIIPDTVKGKKLTHIGEGSFSDSQYSKVIIPAAITNIGKDAFKGSSLQTLIILGDDVSETLKIGMNAFANSSKLEIISINRKKISIEEKAFESCTGLTNVFMKGDVFLSGKVFLNDTSLQTVYTDGLLSLGKSYDDFNGCSALESIAVTRDMDHSTFFDPENINDHLTIYRRYLADYTGPRSWTDSDGIVYP